MNLLVRSPYRRTSLIRRCCELRIHWTAVLLVLATWQGSLFAQSSKDTNNITVVSARHVIGLEGARKNARGQLTLAKDVLKFQKNGGGVVEIRTGKITSVSTGQQDKQVGGIPVVLGRAATPFGGGRAIALFSHKKYDVLTLEYQHDDGSLHGAIFQLTKGQAQLIENELAARGVPYQQSSSKEDQSEHGERK